LQQHIARIFNESPRLPTLVMLAGGIHTATRQEIGDSQRNTIIHTRRSVVVEIDAR
jgi:hypothetical protein